MKGLIIVGHGSSRDSANEALAEIADMVASHLQGWMVSRAYLRFGSPDVFEAVEACARQGASTIVIHPYLLTTGGHVTEEIPGLLEKLSLQYPDVEFAVTPPLGAHPALVDAILERVGQTLSGQP